MNKELVPDDLVVVNPQVPLDRFEDLSTSLYPDDDDRGWVFTDTMKVSCAEPDSDGEIEVYPTWGDEDDGVYVEPEMVITLDERDRIVEGMKKELQDMKEEVDGDRR